MRTVKVEENKVVVTVDGARVRYGLPIIEKRINDLKAEMKVWVEYKRLLTKRVPDVAHCLCGGEYYTDKVLGVVCCRCQAPRR